MKVKSTRQDSFALKELGKIAGLNSTMSGTRITPDALVRHAINLFIISQNKQTTWITKEVMEDIKIKAIKSCS